MILLIDSNVILDVLQNREPHYKFSAKVLGICGANAEIKAFVSALSFANISYIMRKELDAEKIESVYHSLSKIFNFEDFKNADIQTAIKLHWKDFEDAIQFVTAERLKADYIITRNVKDFESKKIPVVTPAEFLKIFQED